jgi:hypothetical protein
MAFNYLTVWSLLLLHDSYILTIREIAHQVIAIEEVGITLF